MADRILLNATKGKPKSLSICNKELRNVPPLIGKITSLKTVDLKSNALTDLPPEFSSLKQVIKLVCLCFVSKKNDNGRSHFKVRIRE